MRTRLLIAGSLIVLLGACGADDGSGTPPTINATRPPDASIAAPTLPPETDAGTSPEETQAPEQPEETQPPEEETQPPEETAPPEEQIEETAPPETTSASSVDAEDDGDDDDGTLWWPWVLAALVVIGAVVALTRRRRPGPSWQLRTTTLLDDIEQLTSHLAAVTPGGLHAVAQVDATRLATMRATLRDLIESAPDANSQTALSALTTPIAQLHGAIDAVAMSGDPSIPPAGVPVTQLATQLHTASASVRAYLAVHS